MKKVVFLLLLLLLTNISEVKADTTRTFELENYNILVTEKLIDGSIGLLIEKQGANPFEITYVTNGERYYIKGAINVNDMIILYGSTHIKDAETHYDAVILAFDEDGVFLNKHIQDLGMLEETEKVFYVDGNYIVQYVQHKVIEDDYVFRRNYFMLLDSNFNSVNQLEISEEIKNSKQEGNIVLFTYDWDDYFEFGLDANLELIEHDDLLDIVDNSVYNTPFQITFINEALLNGEIISNGLYIDYPGIYQLEFNEKIYNFIFESIITGIEDGAVYVDPVTIGFSSGNATLNNEVISSGFLVSEPGNYELTIIGTNGYQKQLSFTITSDVSGVINNHIYDDGIEVSFNGEGYINNQFMPSPVRLEEEGDYLLKIRGENNYLESYFFTIDKPEQNMSLLGFVQKFDVVVLVVTLISGAIILKKK